MKRWISAVLAVVLLAGVLAGCKPTTTIAAKVVEVKDWMVTQPQVENNLLKTFESGKYTPQNPLVALNPYGIAPLTALVLFKTDKPTRVTVTVPGKTSDASFTQAFTEMATTHQIPVYGLYAGITNAVQMKLEDQDGGSQDVTVSIQTEAMPDYMVKLEVKTIEPERLENQLTFISGPFAAMNNTMAYDKHGDIRWYSPLKGYSLGFQHALGEGKFLTFGDSYAGAYYSTGAKVVDWMGKVYNEYLVDAQHHDVLPMPNGNLVFLSNDPASRHVEDYIVEINPKTGETVKTWDLKKIFGYPESDTLERDWLHANSLVYDEKSDSFILSSFFLKTVIKFNYQTGEVVWALADAKNPLSTLLDQKRLTPTGSNFEWNAGQHSAIMLPDGKIALFDNGTGRLDKDGKTIAVGQNFSRAVIFNIDENKRTIEQVWEYGRERGAEILSGFISSIQYLGENHYLIDFGGRMFGKDGKLTDNVPAMLQGGTGDATIIEWKDGKVISEVKVYGQQISCIYRASKLNMYENNKEYNLTKIPGTRAGKLAVTPTKPYQMPQQAGTLTAKISALHDRGFQLVLAATVEGAEKDDVLYIQMKDAQRNAFYYPASITGQNISAMVHTNGLKPGSYPISLVLSKKDGTAKIFNTETNWVVE